MMVPTTAMKTAELAFLTSMKNMRTIMQNCPRRRPSRTTLLIPLDTLRSRNSRGCPAFSPCCTLCNILCSQCNNRCSSNQCNDLCSIQCNSPYRSRCNSPCTTRLILWATTLHAHSELPVALWLYFFPLALFTTSCPFYFFPCHDRYDPSALACRTTRRISRLYSPSGNLPVLHGHRSRIEPLFTSLLTVRDCIVAVRTSLFFRISSLRRLWRWTVMSVWTRWTLLSQQGLDFFSGFSVVNSHFSFTHDILSMERFIIVASL